MLLDRYYFCPLLLKKVSRIGFGGWQAGGLHINNGRSIGWQDVNRVEVCRTIADAFEFGINVFDTSDSYGPNFESVRLVANVLRGVPRSSYIISCKIGYTKGEWGADFLTPRNIEERLSSTLEILGTDYVDVFSLHHHGAKETPFSQLNESVELVRSRGWAKQIAVRIGHQSTLAQTGKGKLNGIPRDIEIARLFSSNILCLNASAAIANQIAPKAETVFYFNKPFNQGLVFANEKKYLSGDNRFEKESFSSAALLQLHAYKERNGISNQAIVNYILSQLNVKYPQSTTFVGLRSREHLASILSYSNSMRMHLNNGVEDYMRLYQLTMAAAQD